MSNRLSKVQKLVYTPAIAPIAAREAYCVIVTSAQSYSGIRLFGGGSVAPVQPTAQVIAKFLDGSTEVTISYTSDGGSYSPYAPTQVSRKVCYPAVKAVAGTPSKIDTLDNFAWNAGARSIDPVPENGFFRAQLSLLPVGVQVGLCRRGFSSTYSEMSHSLVARRDLFSIVEGGSQVFGPAALPASAVVEVRRNGGVASYWVDDVEVYQSAIPSLGEAYGGALLYSAIDYVDTPALGALSEPVPMSFSAAWPGLVAAISEDAEYNAGVLEMPGLQLLATLDAVPGYMQFSGVLPGLVSAISETADVAWMRAKLRPMTLSATLGLEEEIPSSFIGLLPPLMLSSGLRSGGSLSFSGVLPLAFVGADIASYSRLDAVMPMRLRMTTREPYLPANMVDGSDAMAAVDVHSLETALLLIAMDSLDVSGSAELVIVLEMVGLDSLDLSDSTTLGSIVELLALEQVSIMSHAGAARQQALQYAVNYLTGALTTYSDFDFIGFTQHAGDAFAWRADGLYRLGAESTEVIQMLADFGASDYGDAHLKRTEAAFVGVRTDGECYLRVTADDGIERVYRLLGDGNQKRAQLAKGVASRYWNLRLELTDASFATLDNVELAVGVTQRRGYSRSS